MGHPVVTNVEDDSVWFPVRSMARTSQEFSVCRRRNPGGTRSLVAVVGIMTSSVMTGRAFLSRFQQLTEGKLGERRLAALEEELRTAEPGQSAVSVKKIRVPSPPLATSSAATVSAGGLMLLPSVGPPVRGRSLRT